MLWRPQWKFNLHLRREGAPEERAYRQVESWVSSSRRLGRQRLEGKRQRRTNSADATRPCRPESNRRVGPLSCLGGGYPCNPHAQDGRRRGVRAPQNFLATRHELHRPLADDRGGCPTRPWGRSHRWRGDCVSLEWTFRLRRPAHEGGRRVRFFRRVRSLEPNEEDLRPRPLEERREALSRLVTGIDIIFSEAIAAEGALVFAKACAMGLGHRVKASRRPLLERAEQAVAKVEEQRVFALALNRPPIAAAISCQALNWAEREGRCKEATIAPIL